MNLDTNVTHIDIPEGRARRISVGQTLLWQDEGLPTAFQRCEYISGAGNISTYIDTGLNFHTSHDFDEVKIKCRLTQYMGSFNTVFGVGSTNVSADNIFRIVSRNYSGAPSLGWDIADHTVSITYDDIINNTYEIDAKYANGHETLVVNGNTIVDDDYAYEFQPFDGTALLFSSRLGAGPYHFWHGDIFGFLALKNGQIVQRFIQCYLRAEWNGIPAGTIGTYDLAGTICPLTNTPFFINAGTGVFGKGADVI